MGHRDDDIALFVSGVDVPVSLDHVFQGIASIDDRVDLPRLNQLCEESQILRLLACCPTYDLLAASPGSPLPSNHL